MLALAVNTLGKLFGGLRLKISAPEDPRAVVEGMLAGKLTAFDSQADCARAETKEGRCFGQVHPAFGHLRFFGVV